MHPQHQNFLYAVKLLDKKLPQKFLVSRPTPHPPTSNQKLAIFGLLTKLRPPEIRGGVRRSAKIFLSENHFIWMHHLS